MGGRGRHGPERGIGARLNRRLRHAWCRPERHHPAGARLAHHARPRRSGDSSGEIEALDELSALAAALAASSERLTETEAQGRAFAETTADAWQAALPPRPYPVAVGEAAARLGVPLDPAALLFLHAFAANLVSVYIRLVPLGQSQGQRVLAALMAPCRRAAAEALTANLDDISGAAFRADIAAMRHETQPVRLFRT